MSAILRRELSSYFNSAVGYVVLAVFWLFSGLSFYTYCLLYNTSSMQMFFASMFTVIVLIIPLITMRSFAEERRRKTDQALLTAPVNLFEIVFGKFLAAFILFFLCNLVFVLYAIIIAGFTAPDWAVFFSTFFGILLLGAALIAVDMFISALTESQMIAVTVSIGIGILITRLGDLAEYINTEWVTNLINKISFDKHFSNFFTGIISLSSVVFYLSVCAVFLFLTARVFEKRRWS
ncbi:MAG: ABC transporter permease subunit [Ruminococcus sp.]|nr:ABC transporter permease subunit [Ruminococcus sp.]